MGISKELITERNAKLYKEPLYSNVSATMVYAIFSVGKKYKTVGEVSGFQAHMCREIERINIPNADASKTYLNENLRGNNNVVETLKHYLSDCVPWKKNQVCAREILLSCSKDFFDRLSEDGLKAWVEENYKFLEESFHENFLFGVVHLDESVPHIHALISPKFYDHAKQEWHVQHYKYFDGKDKLRDWQTKYSEHIRKTFPEIQRGVLYKKAVHNEIQRIYGILDSGNLDISEQDAKTKLQLQDIKLKRLEGTVENIKLINNKLILENCQLVDENKDLKEQNTLMNKAVKDMMIRRHIPPHELDLSKAKVQTQSKDNQKSIGS